MAFRTRCHHGLRVFLTWPLALFVLRDKPSDVGQFADGGTEAPAEARVQPHSFKHLLSSYSFWLLLVGSACSISSIGAVNFHMKFASKTRDSSISRI